MMKRYEHYGTLDGGGPAEAIQEADGEWVRYEDAVTAVAAERERCNTLDDDMLRYAMAAVGTGSPKDAERFRLFWRFAIEARNTRA